MNAAIPGLARLSFVFVVAACGGGGGGGSEGIATPANADSPLGINLNRFAYFNPEWVFVDAFKQASSWFPQEANSNKFNTGYPLTLNADGWPILGTNPDGNPEAAGVLMFNGTSGHYPAGTYVCLYEGSGTIQFSGDVQVGVESAGRVELIVNATSNSGIALKIVASDPVDPIRNIRVFMPGFELKKTVFHPTFLDRLKKFKIIRFMEVQRTNGSHEVEWDDRTETTWYSQADNNVGNDRGPAYEYLIDLCNELHADPWLCIPHMASDDYVAQLAVLVRDRLDPDLHAWIEYSNEVWNPLFPQNAWCAQEGFLRGYDANPGIVAALRFQSARSVEIFQSWEAVFGSHDRFVRVLAGQAGNPDVGVEIMDWQSASTWADAYAIAPSFGAPNITPQNAPGKTVDDVIADLYNGITATMQRVDLNFLETQSRGLPLIAYEGGQALVGTDSVTQQLFAAANRSPGIYAPYVEHLEQWRAHGGGAFVHFNSSSLYDDSGFWGLIEFQDQNVASTLTAPKFFALDEFIDANPRWW